MILHQLKYATSTIVNRLLGTLKVFRHTLPGLLDRAAEGSDLSTKLAPLMSYTFEMSIAHRPIHTQDVS